MAKDRETAGIVAPPPLIYGVALIASIVADRRFCERRLPPMTRALSIGFFAAAFSLVAPAVAEFKRAGTPIDPFEETTALIQCGPYKYSRNPLYLALTFAYAGVALAMRAGLPLAVLPAVLWVMNAGVIDREEQYLERKFGTAYAQYRQRVPRWI